MELVKEIFKLYKNNNSKIYLVGGSSRDYLLNKEILDYDFASLNLPIENAKIFNTSIDKYSEKFGTFKVLYNNKEIVITTLRIEAKYKDFRRPNFIKFTKSIFLDSFRRDFTINAIYIDQNFKIYDYHKGLKDLNNKLIRTIGNPYIRLKQDPIRILRALRFSLEYNFKIDTKLDKAIFKTIPYLKYVSKDRINAELNKIYKVSKISDINNLFNYYNLDIYLDK